MPMDNETGTDEEEKEDEEEEEEHSYVDSEEDEEKSTEGGVNVDTDFNMEIGQANDNEIELQMLSSLEVRMQELEGDALFYSTEKIIAENTDEDMIEDGDSIIKIIFKTNKDNTRIICKWS